MLLRKFKITIGLLSALPAYTCVFFLPMHLATWIFLDFGRLPRQPPGDSTNQLFYDFLLFEISVEPIWTSFLVLSLAAAGLQVSVMAVDVGLERLGDVLPVAAHLLIFSVFGFLCLFTLGLASLVGFHHP